MIRYLTWRNIFGILLLAILVMIWPFELIGWYSLHNDRNSDAVLKINALTGHATVWIPPHEKTTSEALQNIEKEVLGSQPTQKMVPGHWQKVGW